MQTPNGPAYVSQFPEPNDPLLVLNVWKGNLGLDTGVPQNVYQLDEARMTQVKDADGRPRDPRRQARRDRRAARRPGHAHVQRAARGSSRSTCGTTPRSSYVLVFALLAFAGLATSLFAPRRRVWLRFAPGPQDADGRTVVTAAGLARGDDVGLQPELDRVLAATLAPRRHPDREGTP